MASVQNRARPEFDSPPIKLGSFNIIASADTRISYNDNIYATRDDTVKDVLAATSAAVNVESTWSRHSLAINADASIIRGLSQSDENTETYGVQTGVRFDIGRNTKISARAAYSRAFEPRGSIGDTTVGGPRISYNTLVLSAQAQQTLGRLLLEADANLDTFHYTPYEAKGANASQRNRDYRSWSAGGRAGYSLSPGVAVFVEGTYNKAQYPDETTSYDRSSNGYSLRSGVQFGVTRLIQGRAAIGYQNQRYDDPSFPRIKGLDFGASLEWSPTRLVTWSIETKRTIQRSPIVDVAGIRQSHYGTRIDYELRHNLIVSGRLNHILNKYAGTERSQKDQSATIEAEWLVNRNLRFSAQTGLQWTRSEGMQRRQFDRKHLSLGIRYTL